ncbi:MAG: hypothetical protein ACI4SG_00910 [Oligosphaeraceae bacterium]
MRAFLSRLCLLLLGVSLSLAAQYTPNDICLPRKLYLLEGVPLDIHTQPMLRRWRPYDDFVRFSGDKGVRFQRRLSQVATIASAEDGAMLTASLVNADEFQELRRLQSRLCVARPSAGEGEVVAQILGDSYTHGCFFRQALLQKDWVPGLRLVGLRQCAPEQFDEGRGGWSLWSYFQIPKGDHVSYHGYLHPQGNYRYYGDRAFWRQVWKVAKGTAPKGFEPTYSCSRFQEAARRFDEATGTLLSPQKGDLQYESEEKCFLLYDGGKWVTRQEKDFTWSVDYGKYLEMWNLPAPQFLFVILGVNDFRDRYDADFQTWDEEIRELEQAYHQAVPNGYFVLCIPCSTMGSLDNVAGDFTVKQNAAMWRFREHLIQEFDDREHEGFYLLDTGVCVSNQYGYQQETSENYTLPYAGYPDKDRLFVQKGNPHPYSNYGTMGIPLAAFMQYYRDRW